MHITGYGTRDQQRHTTLPNVLNMISKRTNKNNGNVLRHSTEKSRDVVISSTDKNTVRPDTANQDIMNLTVPTFNHGNAFPRRNSKAHLATRKHTLSVTTNELQVDGRKSVEMKAKLNISDEEGHYLLVDERSGSAFNSRVHSPIEQQRYASQQNDRFRRPKTLKFKVTTKTPVGSEVGTQAAAPKVRALK